MDGKNNLQMFPFPPSKRRAPDRVYCIIKGSFISLMMFYSITIESQAFFGSVSVTRKLSGIVAHNLSGLDSYRMEVTDEMDRDAAGDPEDAI